uniref:Uncharacterized protein n=1 Tax=Branchiostoma floridae TaxID=7739 RepID=C3ZA96_BRAFL|eukprot:XP_002594478.1 hypothetical protein BRAFLDRAFT_124957 [Branchiostoma floridae]
MEREGKVQFLRHHQGSVRGVAFCPRDRYLFCSGAYDGKVNLYSAQKGDLLHTYNITTLSLARNINAVRFTSDGCRILATTTARRLAIIDVESGEQLGSYDSCAFNGRDRTGLAADPTNPSIALCCTVNGKGVTVFDLRMPLPLDFINDLHGNIIRDLTFLHDSWPWCKGQSAFLSVSVDGTAKVTTLDGKTLQTVDCGSCLHSAAPTPEIYGSMADDGFYSLIMLGGDSISAYVPEVGIQELLQEHGEAPVWKISSLVLFEYFHLNQ